MKKLIAIILTSFFVISCFGIATTVSADDDLPYQRILYIPKTDTEPNLWKIDASWGEPLIHVSKELPEVKLVEYWGDDPHPNVGKKDRDSYMEGLRFGRYIWSEECDFDFYCLWDENNIYLAVVSPDDEPSGWVERWGGDGVQLWIKHRNEVLDPYEHYNQGMHDLYWTLGQDDYTSYAGGELGETIDDPFLEVENGFMTAIVKIPFKKIRINAADVKDGLPIALVLQRISSRSPRDNGYAGYLQWGFEYVITLVLDDPEIENKPIETIAPIWGPPIYDPDHPGETIPQDTEPVTTDDTAPKETNPPETEDTTADVTPNLDGVSSWALTEVEAGIKEGLVPANLQANYTSPVTRGAVAQMFVNLLEKAAGKSIDDIMAEKGVTINEGAFTDTTDKAVLAANALSIINGTGGGKFSPDGTLKRAQIAAIINRVARVMGVETEGYTHEFIDITDNYSWADSELGWPVHAGVVNGVGQGKFNPGGDLTTEQAILITYRALGALK